MIINLLFCCFVLLTKQPAFFSDGRSSDRGEDPPHPPRLLSLGRSGGEKKLSTITIVIITIVIIIIVIVIAIIIIVVITITIVIIIIAMTRR